MAFNFENLINKLKDTVSGVAQSAVSSAATAIQDQDQEAANALRRERERTEIPETVPYYENAEQAPIDVGTGVNKDLGEASSSVVPNVVDAMMDELDQSGYEPDKYLNGKGASLLKPKFEKEGNQGFESSSGGNIDETAETANKNWLDNLIDNEGALNPNNWFILGTTEKEKQRKKDQKAYKEENATQDWMDTDANVPITNDEWQQKYFDYWNSKGGLEEGYRTGDQDVLDGLNKLLGIYSPQDMGFESSKRPSGNGISDIVSGLDKISNENYDDGTLRWDSVKGKYMKGSEYKELVNAGFGGRPIEEIDDNATYNKLDEAASYGFIPFIQDQDQWNYWDATQVADNVSKAYNLFGDTRDRWTNEYVDYNGQRIDRDQFLDEADKTAQKWLKENGDQGKFVIPMEDGNDEVIVSNENPIVDYGYVLRDSIGDSSIEDDNVVVWFPNLGRYFIYPDDQDYQDNHPYADTRIPGVEYQQWDGSTVSLDADEFDDLLAKLSTGSAQVDYSTGNPIIDTIFPNIGKNSTDRKDFSGMLGSLDFSDLAPNMADLFFGSAPLFFKQTAWPMAIANGISASEGLDARNYDNKHGEYQRLAQDMNAEKYIPNVLLSSTVPATERIAGIIGGKGGLIGTPIQKALAEAGAPALLRYGLGVGGEGLEEIIASAWEDFQTNGWSNWFANPIYETDDNGNVVQSYNAVTGKMEPKIKADTTGHQMRDPNTPWWERIGNFGDQALENGLGGSALGLSLGVPTVVHDKVTNSGYFADDLQKGKFGYRVGNPGDNLVRITREDYGTYGKGKR